MKETRVTIEVQFVKIIILGVLFDVLAGFVVVDPRVAMVATR